MVSRQERPNTVGDTRRRRIVRIGWLVPLAALVLLLTYSFKVPVGITQQQAMAAAVMSATAALVVGALLGFLFGIPRVLQRNNDQPIDRAGSATYEANTNLEQISDWLTKILVGAGIAQFGAITQTVGHVIDEIALAMGGGAKANIMAASLVIFFSVWGFLLGYLLTRTYLPGLFRASDAEEITMMAAERAVQALEDKDDEQDAVDARAYGLAARLISPSTSGQASITRTKDLERFRETIPIVSRAIREQIYHMAQSQRRENWNWRDSEERDDERRMLHDRTIEVLAALAEADPDSAMIQGDLGFALKDKQNPDVDGAIAALTKAIGLAEDAGYRLTADWYAVNRALARIYNWDRLDADLRDQHEDATLADLLRAQHSQGNPKKILSEARVRLWIEEQGFARHFEDPDTARPSQ